MAVVYKLIVNIKFSVSNPTEISSDAVCVYSGYNSYQYIFGQQQNKQQDFFYTCKFDQVNYPGFLSRVSYSEEEVEVYSAPSDRQNRPVTFASGLVSDSLSGSLSDWSPELVTMALPVEGSTVWE